MLPGAPVVTAQQMRDAELAAVATGVSLALLMDRAGHALATLVHRMAAGRPVHILAGPGNNGGDGYVAAAYLKSLGTPARVSASAPPNSPLAQAAAGRWHDDVGDLADAPIAGAVLVDCLFGTGLDRPLPLAVAAALAGHASVASRRVAADLPSGLSTDDGAVLNCPYTADVTLAFGAFKLAHLLFPAAAHCGEVLLSDLGLTIGSPVTTAAMPMLSPPDHDSHKYRRGLVAIVAGKMAGAAELAARGAVRGGAGYVKIFGGRVPPSPPYAVVRAQWAGGDAVHDERIGAVVLGCGLGLDATAEAKVAATRASGKPMVIDADALHFVGDAPSTAPVIMTPHAGEFARLWGGSGSKIERTRAAAAHWKAVIVHKGPDTVIAAPDGRVAVHSPGSPWLSTAGTGDVLAGLCGAMLARGLAPFDAAQAAVLFHAQAARRAGPGFCADDLVAEAIWP